MPRPIEISQVTSIQSSQDRQFLRISAEVDYGSPFAQREVAWFEVPSSHAYAGNGWGDPWLISFLPLAVTLGKPLRIEAMPVDRQLLENAQELMSIWSDWFAPLSPIEIQAEGQARPPASDARRTAAFFSGGVDSFFTAIRSKETNSEELDGLIFLQGADLPIRSHVALDKLRRRYRTVAAELGCELIVISTNLRETRFDLASWGDLSHACLMAGAALQLSGYYSTVLISAGYPQEILSPHASHPKTDRLLSNSQTVFRHYGVEFRRDEKIKYLLEHKLALDNLRVCYKRKDGENCGRCRKCKMTMATLEAYGKLSSSNAFAGLRLDMDQLRRTHMGAARGLYREIPRIAREQGRNDLAEAIEAAYRRTTRLRSLMLFGLIPRLHPILVLRPTARLILRPIYRALRRFARWLNTRLP